MYLPFLVSAQETPQANDIGWGPRTHWSASHPNRTTLRSTPARRRGRRGGDAAREGRGRENPLLCAVSPRAVDESERCPAPRLTKEPRKQGPRMLPRFRSPEEGAAPLLPRRDIRRLLLRVSATPGEREGSRRPEEEARTSARGRGGNLCRGPQLLVLELAAALAPRREARRRRLRSGRRRRHAESRTYSTSTIVAA
jgi:hypothetical protein